MIYKGFDELIPSLKLTVLEYYTECYDVKTNLLENPILALSSKDITILGFESKTKSDINLTSFANDSISSKNLFKILVKSKFYFTIWTDKKNPEEIFAEDILFTTIEELKGYMQKFLEKGN